jgi:8-oxo-dGTP diphosphatase
MGAGLNVYVAVFLFRKNRVLLLERAPHKGFAPGRWTGVGGRVEPDEMSNLEAAALREVAEEAGIEAEDVEDLDIRVVLTRPEDGDVTTVVFFAGYTDREGLPPCSEGRLHWVALDRVDGLDLVENAGYALNLAIKAEESGFSGVYFAVEDPTRSGAISAVRVNRSALGHLPGQREIQ